MLESQVSQNLLVNFNLSPNYNQWSLFPVKRLLRLPSKPEHQHLFYVVQYIVIVFYQDK